MKFWDTYHLMEVGFPVTFASNRKGWPSSKSTFSKSLMNSGFLPGGIAVNKL